MQVLITDFDGFFQYGQLTWSRSRECWQFWQHEHLVKVFGRGKFNDISAFVRFVLGKGYKLVLDGSEPQD